MIEHIELLDVTLEEHYTMSIAEDDIGLSDT